MTDSYLPARGLAKGARTAALVGSACALFWAGACSSGASPESLASSSQALVGDGLVISQVYGAGGNGKAPLNEDFVELFNRSDSPVSLAGLSLQYGSATGEFGAAPADGGAETSITVLPDMSVGPGAYFLVGMSTTNAGVGAALPTPDFVGPTDLAPQNGKIALARVTAPLGCGTSADRCPATNVVDLVGYGAATDYAGAAAVPALSAANAGMRDGAGCVDTGQNAADFSLAAPAPRNSATAARSCDTGRDAGEAGVVVTLDASSPSGDGGGATDDGGTVAPPDDASTNDAGAVDAGESDAGESDGGEEQDGGGAEASPLVISQVFGGGGNAGSPYASDFVELFNRSNGPVSLSGLALQYAEKATSFGANLADGAPSDNVLALPAATLAAGEYFLVGLGAKGVGTGGALPTPDATGTINLAATAGKVAITTITSALGCGAAADRCPLTNIVDLVGYGASTDYEGSGPVTALTKTTAALRNDDGCAATHDNASDFSVGAPAPRNSATARVSCGAVSTDAGAGGGNNTDAGAGLDAGAGVAEDSGATSDDSGVTGDSGVMPDDSGAATGDSGAPEADGGGSVTGSGGSSGCSCSTLGGTRGRTDWAGTTGAALLLATLVRRRRLPTRAASRARRS
jgi:hypothetical protein